MKTSRLIALLTTLVLCFTLLASCGGSPQTTESPAAPAPSAEPSAGPVQTVEGISDETLYVATEGEPNSLCPLYSGGNVNARVDVELYDTLVYWNDEKKVAEPSVATDWEWVDDTHLSLTLRDDVYFSNGDQLTAKDVAFTFTVGAQYSLSTYYTKLDPENFEIVDDQHIILAFSAPMPNFIDVVGSTHYALLSEKSWQDAGEDLSALAHNPVGSGKYMLQEWKQGESITLVRNDNYWDQDNLPYYKYITYYIITDAASRVIALESGQVQVAYSISSAQVEEVDQYEGLNALVYSQNISNVVCFNYANEALKDLNVRKAVALAINRDAFRQVSNQGYGDLVDTIYTPSTSVYTHIEPEAQDLEQARQLLADAGYGSGLTLNCVCSPANATSAEVLQAQLAEIGIEVKVEQQEMATFLNSLFTGAFDIVVSSIDNWDYQMSLVPIDSRNDYATAIGGSLYQGEDQQELYDLIDAASHEMDEAARLEDYAAVQQFVADHYVAVGLCSAIRCEGYSESITGITYDVRGWPCLSFVRPVA